MYIISHFILLTARSDCKCNQLEDIVARQQKFCEELIARQETMYMEMIARQENLWEGMLSRQQLLEEKVEQLLARSTTQSAAPQPPAPKPVSSLLLAPTPKLVPNASGIVMIGVTKQGKVQEELTRKRQRKWIENLCRSDIKESSYPNIRVCSDDFVSGKPSYIYDETNIDWAPTLKMGHENISETSIKLSIERSKRLRDRKSRGRCISAASGVGDGEIIDDAFPGAETDSSMETFETDSATGTMNQECQTELSVAEISTLQNNLQKAQDEIYSLRKKVADLTLNVDLFKNDSNKVRYFTGLPDFNILMAVYNFVAPSVARTHNNVLTKFQELLIVLMCLRLNASFQDLAYRFSISVSTTSRIFYRWLPVMDVRLSHLIHWPERECLQKLCQFPLDSHLVRKWL
ncbi:uncharacterized protein LOC117105386 [Anneissia japonica]|uniref:uncharacterized protein LOC117105386 n=1 Tax=Anneissia japonica TaxID=1529436 RepID=UPI0014259AB7|nr:uncharacterized protein LOC117105386 [Anneissia japonica]